MTELNLSRKGERTLSNFVGHELLYDYLKGELDPERRLAMEELMGRNREVKADLEKIRDGLQYVCELQKTQVSDQLIESIRTPSTYFQVLLQKTKFSDWPESIKLAGEGILIGVAAMILILAIPWERILSFKHEFSKSGVVLTEVAKTKHSDPDSESSDPANQEANSNQALVYEDEVKPSDTPPSATSVPAPGSTAPIVAALSPTTPAVAPTHLPGSPVKAPESALQKSTVETAAPDTGKKQGFLYRGTVSVTNVEAVTPKLVEFIDSIGGRKAGEVELGWKKGDGSYFHFTIPQAKFESLVEIFKEYGTLKISKEPHPRVMPDGIIRLIITVDEK